MDKKEINITKLFIEAGESYEKLTKGIDSKNYIEIYEVFEEHLGVVLNYFGNDRIPIFQFYSPFEKYCPKVKMEHLVDKNKLELIAEGIKNDVGILRAIKFKKTILNHYKSEAKFMTKNNKLTIKNYNKYLENIF